MDASVSGVQAESKDGVRTNLQMGPSWSVEQLSSAHLSVYTQKEGGHVLGAGAKDLERSTFYRQLDVIAFRSIRSTDRNGTSTKQTC